MLVSIQILRALAAWIVVGHHVTQIFAQVRDGSAIGRLFAEYGAYGVDLFFVISGLAIYLTSTKPDATPREFMLRRLARVVPPYWIYTAVTAAVLMIDNSLIPFTRLEWPFFVQSMFFVPADNPSGIGVYPLLTVGWTLNYEMVFYAIYFIAMFAPTRLRLSAVAAAVLLLVFLVPKFGDQFQFYGNRIVLEFLLGLVIGVGLKRGVWRRLNPAVGVVLIALALGAIGWHGGATHSFTRVGIPCAAIVVGSIALERYAAKVKLAVELGDWSYSTYLCHFLVLCIGHRIYQTFDLPVWMVITISIVVIAALSYVSFRAVEQPASTAARRLLRPSSPSGSLV